MSYILVTGCNGFIGSKLTKELLKKGYRVLGLSTKEEPLFSHENLKYIQLNLIDTLAVEKLFREHEISSVIHLAAIAHLKGRKVVNWNEFYRNNVLVSRTIFQCAINSNARMFFASTVDVYGDINVSMITEEYEPLPKSDYANSKYIAENILKELAEENNLDYCIGRFAPVYGKHFMKDIYKRIYLKYPSLAFIVGDGCNYHFVSVNNVVDFIIHWIDEKNNIVGTFNVCDEELINSKEFIALEKNKGNSKKVIYLPNKLFAPLKVILELCYKLTKNEKINKIRKNLYKLILPPRYSTKRIENVVSLRWNIQNTVYEDIE